MAKYMFTGTFTLQGGKGVMAEGGSSRARVVAAAFESVGGKMESYHFAFGADDYVVIGEVPDSVTAAALALTVGSSGGVNNRTVALLTPEEVDRATKLTPSYRAPGS
jgi:uncharacterized protein with GYD domain